MSVQIAQQILDQIKHNADQHGNSGVHLMMCWGFRSPVALGSTDEHIGGLQFKVAGMKHRGAVQVMLNAMDLYDVIVMTSRGKEKRRIENVYFDQLLEVIDGAVESGSEAA